MSFENVGVLKLASTGRSYRIEITDRVLTKICYVSKRDVELVKAGKKKTATIYVLKREV